MKSKVDAEFFGMFVPQFFMPLAPAAALLVSLGVCAAEAEGSGTHSNSFLLRDSLGRLVRVPTNDIPAGLRPISENGLSHQIPQSSRGTRQPKEVGQRIKDAHAGTTGLTFFPPTQPRLMPYLADLDEFGNTAVQPGALINLGPLEPEVQAAKYWLSEHGLRYLLEQTLTGVGMTGTQQGDNTSGLYTLNLQAKWAVYDKPAFGAGWLSSHLEVQAGIGAAGETQSPAENLGTLSEPVGIWSPVNGVSLPELAWQQSFADGELLILGGVVNQSDYLDMNAYANNGRGQFLNSALINSMVLPLPEYNFGVNLQWQPHEDWYGMLGASVGNAFAGQVPWTDFNWQSWSLPCEIGYAPEDVLGLGAGVYRIQPFIGQADGSVQGGLGLNIQQELGAKSPFGWFGRFGIGGSEVNGGAKAQIGTGFVLHAPLQSAGLFPEWSDDLAGVGFVWSQPSSVRQTVYHENEYLLETFYALQLTPLTKLQTDVQIIWNPAFNPDPGPAAVLQLQFVLFW